MDPTAGLDGFEESKNLLPLPGFEHRLVRPVASRYTDYAYGKYNHR